MFKCDDCFLVNTYDAHGYNKKVDRITKRQLNRAANAVADLISAMSYMDLIEAEQRLRELVAVSCCTGVLVQTVVKQPSRGMEGAEMQKTIIGLMPFAIGLAAIGIAIWWLLGQEMALGRWLLAAFLVANGLIHLLFVVPQPATSAEGSGAAEWPFDMTRSWLVSGAGLGVNLVHVIGVALICAVTIGFLLAGLATVGILVPTGWWSDLVVASSVASAVLLALFFNPQLVLGVAIDIVLLWIVLATVWAPTTAASNV